MVNRGKQSDEFTTRQYYSNYVFAGAMAHTIQ